METSAFDGDTSVLVPDPRAVRIAFGDTSDPRVRDAAQILVDDDVVIPVFVQTSDAASPPAGVEVVVVPDGVDALAHLAVVVSGTSVSAGIAGSLSSSAAVIRAGIRGLPRRGLISGCFLMDVGGVRTTYADCSVVPDPTDDQLADIAIAAADHHRACTGDEPRIAMLSFSTDGSASHPAVDKVRRATAILRARRPDLVVEGEIQFDVAVNPAVGIRKMPGSRVAGRANVLVFPTLDAGNIAYKVAERIGGARALGSFVLNLGKPWVDVSRGCSTEDLTDTARVLAGLSPTSSPSLTSHAKESSRP